MGTTSLIVEMVIIGFQVLVWMSLIVLILFGYKGIDLSKLKDWTAVISLALVGASYTLGIVFNSFVGALFAHWEFESWRWLLRPSDLKGGEHPARMRAYITAFNSGASEDLTKRTNRNSLVRAKPYIPCLGTETIWSLAKAGCGNFIVLGALGRTYPAHMALAVAQLLPVSPRRV